MMHLPAIEGASPADFRALDHASKELLTLALKKGLRVRKEGLAWHVTGSGVCLAYAAEGLKMARASDLRPMYRD